MNIGPDASTPNKDSTSAVRLEAKEFTNALLVYPLTLEFTLYNLQGDLGIRRSCTPRGKVPDELDFASEIDIASRLGWLKELPEDTELSTNQGSETTGIRYGRTFVRASRGTDIQKQREQFVSQLAGVRQKANPLNNSQASNALNAPPGMPRQVRTFRGASSTEAYA